MKMSAQELIKCLLCILPGTGLATGQWVKVAPFEDPCTNKSLTIEYLCHQCVLIKIFLQLIVQ